MKKIGIALLMVLLIISLGLNLFFFFKSEPISDLKIIYQHSGDIGFKQVWCFISSEEGRGIWKGFLMHRVGENKFLITLPKKAGIRPTSYSICYIYLPKNYIESEEMILDIPKILQLTRIIYP